MADDVRHPVETAVPVTISYAGREAVAARAPLKLPRPAIRQARVWSVLSVVSIGLACIAWGEFLVICVVSAAFTGVVALSASMLAVHRNSNAMLEERERLRGLSYKLIVIAAILTFFLGLLAGFRVLKMVREGMVTSVAVANLRGAFHALCLYERDHGRPADSLATLLADGNVTPKQLISPLDPHATTLLAASASSFVYRPCPLLVDGGSRLLVLFERQPFCNRGVRLFPQKVHAVLASDGHPTMLTPEELVAALEQDAQRRAELGWPVPP